MLRNLPIYSKYYENAPINFSYPVHKQTDKLRSKHYLPPAVADLNVRRHNKNSIRRYKSIIRAINQHSFVAVNTKAFYYRSRSNYHSVIQATAEFGRRQSWRVTATRDKSVGLASLQRGHLSAIER